MYPNNNMMQTYGNYPTFYQNYNNSYRRTNNRNYGNDRLIAGGGFLAPFLLGGITGYAFGRPNYYPYNYYYNNFYYPYYRPFYY